METNALLSPIEHFYKWESTLANKVFLKQPYGSQWKTISYSQAGQQARKMSTALKALGLTEGDHIGIISKNCYHWIIADLAIMMSGMVSVPFYASLGAKQLSEVIDKSDCKALFIGKLEKWDTDKEAVLKDIHAIHFPHYPGSATIDFGLNWTDVINKHEPVNGNYIPDLDSLWTIIFTSGTTGSPKGVMHTQRNAALLMHSEEKHNSLKTFDFPAGGNRFFSFLPMNHIAERVAIEIGALLNGGSIAFAESLDTFAKNLKDTSPTMFFAVPRIWTKFHLGVLAKSPQEKLDKLLKIPIVSGLIKKKIRKALGLKDAVIMLTGASITPEPLKEWYRSLGMNLREVYGMTENFGGFSMMPETEHKADTVGKPVPGAKVKIEEQTGEILMNIPWLMTGYYKDPELTAQSIIDGWMHTGDKGELDDQGFLKVIGRVKDTFKTAKGKFIVPTIIEEEFAGQESIEQLCVTGLGLSQPVALLCLSDIGKRVSKDSMSDNLQGLLDDINPNLEPHERLSALIVCKDAWSDENGLLTPTLKVKRASIHDRYKHMLTDWCESNETIIWE